MNRRDCGDGPAPWQFYWDANREAMVRMVEVVPEGIGGRITDDRTGRSAGTALRRARTAARSCER